MTIRVLFFGPVRDVVGRGEEQFELTPGLTAGSLYDLYAARYPRLAALRQNVLLAVNQEFAARDLPLKPGDEAAFLPPVSGGTGGHRFAITRDAIDPAELSSRTIQDIDGALVTFHGVTRNQSLGRRTLHLHYDCYEPMALKVLTDLGLDIAARHAISRICIVHRIGKLDVGETSVCIAVAAPHRQAAFDACREAIDTLKKKVPIWKKEFFEDGEVWVEGAWDESLKPV